MMKHETLWTDYMIVVRNTSKTLCIHNIILICEPAYVEIVAQQLINSTYISVKRR